MDKFILKKIFNDAPNDGNYIAICSTIAGYHEFLVRQLSGSRFPLGLRLEKTNVYHSNAILVLSATSDKYSPSVVEQCKGRDIFNKKTGRVPRQLADILAPQLESGKLIKGLAFYTDKIINKGQQSGGGPHLCCIYLLKMRSKDTLMELHELLHDYHCKVMSN